MSDLNIESQAGKAKRVTVDGQSVEKHSLPDLIEAEKHLDQKAGAQQRNFGIRMGQFRNKGTS